METKPFERKPGDQEWDRGSFTKPNGTFVSNPQNQPTFVPKKLPPSLDYDNEMIALLSRAERKVGELRGKADELPNPHILIRMYLKREAVLSSRIEGTLASLEDLNRREAMGSTNRTEAEGLRLGEVYNYVAALEDALRKLDEGNRKIDPDLIREAHRILMSGVRGGTKSPGEFRDRQNWIGKGSKIIYTPPAAEFVPDLLDNLCGFIREDGSAVSTLVQCAVAHYQFEAIHPFLDGNGRIGRLLLPLILYERKILPRPLLYLSAYFETHLQEYYGGLLRVSQTGSWDGWIAFFLRAFKEQADETIESIQRLVDLRNRYADTLKGRNARGHVVSLMERLFENPYVTIPAARNILNISYPGARSAVETLVEAGILRRTDIAHRAKVFLAEEIEATLA